MSHSTKRQEIFGDGTVDIAQDLGASGGFSSALTLRVAYPGTDLGLAIVRKAAERMSDSVGVGSLPGFGRLNQTGLSASDTFW